MKSVLQPWQLLLLILAGWLSRHQQEVLEYLPAENQVVKEKIVRKRILLTDDLSVANNPSPRCWWPLKRRVTVTLMSRNILVAFRDSNTFRRAHSIRR